MKITLIFLLLIIGYFLITNTKENMVDIPKIIPKVIQEIQPETQEEKIDKLVDSVFIKTIDKNNNIVRSELDTLYNTTIANTINMRNININEIKAIYDINKDLFNSYKELYNENLNVLPKESKRIITKYEKTFTDQGQIIDSKLAELERDTRSKVNSDVRNLHKINIDKIFELSDKLDNLQRGSYTGILEIGTGKGGDVFYNSGSKSFLNEIKTTEESTNKELDNLKESYKTSNVSKLSNYISKNGDINDSNYLSYDIKINDLSTSGLNKTTPGKDLVVTDTLEINNLKLKNYPNLYIKPAFYGKGKIPVYNFDEFSKTSGNFYDQDATTMTLCPPNTYMSSIDMWADKYYLSGGANLSCKPMTEIKDYSFLGKNSNPFISKSEIGNYKLLMVDGDSQTYCRKKNDDGKAFFNSRGPVDSLESCATQCDTNSNVGNSGKSCTGFDVSYGSNGIPYCYHWNMETADNYEPKKGDLNNTGCYIKKSLVAPPTPAAPTTTTTGNASNNTTVSTYNIKSRS